MMNPWELFSDHPKFAEASAGLDAAIKFAAKLPDWDSARAYMNIFQRLWADVGANDSEPRNHIVDRLNEIFGENVDLYCKRANP